MLANSNDVAPAPHTITEVGRTMLERVNGIDAMLDRLDRLVYFLNGGHQNRAPEVSKETPGGLLHGLVYLDGRLDAIQSRLAVALESAEATIGDRDDFRSVPRNPTRQYSSEAGRAPTTGVD